MSKNGTPNHPSRLRGRGVEVSKTLFYRFSNLVVVAPTIMNTFLEAYDFSGKKIVLFATSGGSGFGETVERLQNSVSESAQIVEGEILNETQTIEEINKMI